MKLVSSITPLSAILQGTIMYSIKRMLSLSLYLGYYFQWKNRFYLYKILLLVWIHNWNPGIKFILVSPKCKYCIYCLSIMYSMYKVRVCDVQSLKKVN